MARQITDLRVFPLTDQVIQVVSDQQGYTSAASLNKIIIRTPDHFPVDVGSTHLGIKDGYAKVISVEGTDPLAVTTSGFSGLSFDGYDGLIIGEDGYVIARGIIKESTTNVLSLQHPGYCSISGHHYIMGGFDVETDGYINDVWHSFTGKVWEKQATPPWGARAHCQLVSDGSDLWLLGGWNTTLDATPLKDLWHASINASNGDLTWDAAAVDSDINFLTDYFKATIHPGTAGPDAYVGAGSINLSTGVETEFELGNDAYGSVIHYDETRNILWFSADGNRDERIIGDLGNHLNPTKVPAFGYVHYQDTVLQEWTITHGLNSFEVAPVCYTTDKEIQIPNSVWWIDENTIRVGWNTAVTGRAMVCHGKYYTGSTWNLTDGYLDNNSAWMVVDTAGDIVEPTSTPTSSQMTFDSSIDGYLVAWTPYDGNNTMAGRRYIGAFDAVIEDNPIPMYQQADAPLTWFRNTSDVLLEPSAYDYTDDKFAIATFTSAESAVRWCSMDLRHDGYRDDQEPWSADMVSFGVNDAARNICYLITSNGIWSSGDAGCNWSRAEASGADFATDRLSPVLVAGNMVAGFESSYALARSLTGGDTFTLYPEQIATQAITWYGDLGVPVDTTYRLFIYERPSDVVWETDYGHFPGTISDELTTHYVLPYPTAIDSSNTQAVSITLDSDYGRAVAANEFEDDWLYLITTATGAIVDRKKIIRNTAAAAGASITIYPKELSVTPTGSHVIQIVKTRAEGAVYYSALNRQTSSGHTLHHEADGTAFIKTKEQEYDYYAHLVSEGGLPAYIQSDANKLRINVLHTELNRQRVVGKQFYNDEDTLPPELLKRLGAQLGVNVDDDLDLQTQRRMISLWHQRVASYGPCLDGVNNLIDLVLGPGSGVTVAKASPDGDTLAGQVVTVNVSQYAEYHFNYASATNVVVYDHDQKKWGLAVDVTLVPADISTLTHRSFVHFRNLVTDGPLLITGHDFNSVTGTLNMYFDTSDIAEISFSDGQSSIGIFTEPRQRKAFKFIKLLRELLPHWVQLKLA